MKVFPRYGMLAATLSLAVSAAVVAATPETDEEKLGYVIGMDIGASIAQQEDPIDLDALFDAIRTAVEGGEPAMSPEEVTAYREAYVAKRQAAAASAQSETAGVNQAEGTAFLADNATKDGVITTASGLQYKVIQDGDGERPGATDTVNVHYRGSLLDGTEFDSSYSRDMPLTIRLDQVIPGWTEGLQLMPVGSKYMFYVDPSLGYGTAGGGPIPPNSTLIFEVEMLGFESAAG